MSPLQCCVASSMQWQGFVVSPTLHHSKVAGATPSVLPNHDYIENRNRTLCKECTVNRVCASRRSTIHMPGAIVECMIKHSTTGKKVNKQICATGLHACRSFISNIVNRNGAEELCNSLVQKNEHHARAARHQSHGVRGVETTLRAYRLHLPAPSHPDLQTLQR